MKRVLLAGLSGLMLSSIAALPVKAQTRVGRELMSYQTELTQSNQSNWSPTDLAFLAYRGGLKDQGIGGYGRLNQEIASGQVTAQTVIKAAIDDRLVSSSTLNDQGYLAQLKETLITFQSR